VEWLAAHPSWAPCPRPQRQWTRLNLQVILAGIRVLITNLLTADWYTIRK
jgi:hypothetical protein